MDGCPSGPLFDIWGIRIEIVGGAQRRVEMPGLRILSTPEMDPKRRMVPTDRGDILHHRNARTSSGMNGITGRAFLSCSLSYLAKYSCSVTLVFICIKRRLWRSPRVALEPRPNKVRQGPAARQNHPAGKGEARRHERRPKE